MKAIVSQITVTVQGEGPSVGTPILLIRLGNCNLNCSFCDTKWSNNLKITDVEKFNPKTKVDLPISIDDTNIDDFINYINNQFLSKFGLSTVLLTGGEPLLNKEFIGSLIYNKISNLDNITKIEIETNGSLLNNKTDYLLFYHWDKTIQINISPKLDPVYYASDKIKTLGDIIALFNNNRITSIDKIEEKTPTTITWKFVYSKDIEESIDRFIKGVPSISSVSIMPMTPNYSNYKTEYEFLEDFRQSCYDTLDYCLKTGYTFVPRAHIFLFNNFINRNEFMDVRKLK